MLIASKANEPFNISAYNVSEWRLKAKHISYDWHHISERHEGEFSGLKSGEARLKCTDEPQPSNPSNHNDSPNEIGDICQHSMQCALSKLQKTHPAWNNWSSLSLFQMLRTTKRFSDVFVWAAVILKQLF